MAYLIYAAVAVLIAWSAYYLLRSWCASARPRGDGCDSCSSCGDCPSAPECRKKK